MNDTQPTLLLTRPEPQSRSFLALCEQRLNRRLPAVISPVIEIEPTGDMPDLGSFATVIFTSANGVRVASDGIRRKQVATVGERTAILAREFGADARALGRNVDEFVKNASGIVGPALHCRGVHSRGGLASRLSALGVEVEEAVIYDQKQRPLSSAARAILSGSGPIVLPVFSPRSAELLSRYPIEGTCEVLALSEAVANAWTSVGQIKIAAEPTRDAMVDLIETVF